jgi:hypothetical protein
MKQTESYVIKIERDGYRWSYTVKALDGKIAVREGGFFKRDSALVQA